MDSTAFWSHWAWPLITGIIGAIFTILLVKQYLDRRKLHQLAWSIGFLVYTIAAFMEAYSEYANSWDPNIYRIYIVFAASLVGFLGLGVLYLIFRKKIYGHIFFMFVLIVMAIFFYGTFTTELVEENLVAGITVGGTALGESQTFPRICSLFLNIPGTIFLLGGAIYSIVLFARKKQYSYRMWANVLIALGTLIIAAAGSMARAGQSVGLYPAEMLGAAFLLWGFLKAGTLKNGVEAVKKEKMDEDVKNFKKQK
ncbi:hypothetical protein ACFLY8_01035 [Halobacteriota archaeon]